MNTQKEIKTRAYVLRRTNYGEADRILNLITPNGKMSVIAKGARKEKSKLAGGIEMFSLVELNVHLGKSEFGIVTSAKMLKYYDKILTDYARMELAAMILKDVNWAAESSDNPEYFKLVDQGLGGINAGADMALVESWFLVNLARAQGEDINLYRDAGGEKLSASERYDWDTLESAFVARNGGEFGATEIKMLRLMSGLDLAVMERVKDADKMLPKILHFVRTASSRR